MTNIKYLLGRVRGLNTARMREKAHEVSALARRPVIAVLADMMWCGLRYQAGYMDYWLFQMWNMNAAQRKTVLTRGKNNAYVKALNSKTVWRVFDNKPEFNKRFAAFMPRKWAVLSGMSAAEFENFARGLGVFIAKPEDGTCGESVEKIDVSGVTDWNGLKEKLVAKKQVLIEEVIKQHPEMDRLWSGSVNTVRVVTILKDERADVAAALLRVGAGERPVDNFNGGGMVVPVDKNTGTVKTRAVDKAGNVYDAHPKTGVAFTGFQIPMWQEIIDFAQRAALVVPEMRYVGWDVAVTPDGPTLVEGNCYPGHDIYGLPAQSPDKCGVLPDWEAVISLKELKKL